MGAASSQTNCSNPEKMFKWWKVILLLYFVTNSNSFDDICGQMFDDPAATAGGTKASIAPWTVSIGYLREKDDLFIHHCTGVIIEASIIVTAAHCTRPPAGKEREDIREVLQIHAGRTNPRLLGVQQRKIKEFFKHPKYDDWNTGYYYDIAILILNEVNPII